MNFIGLAGRGGGLGEKIVVERRWVHPVGDIPLDEAALIEPLAVGYHAFVRTTFLGAALNGPRKRQSLSAAAAID